MPEIRISRDNFHIGDRSFHPVVRLEPLPEFSESVQQAIREFSTFQDRLALEGQFISANDYLELILLRVKRIEEGIKEDDLPNLETERIVFGPDSTPESPLE